MTDRRPIAKCDRCPRTERLFDCPAEIAWPDQWLCGDCMRKADMEYEDDLYERELSAEETP